MANYGLFSGTKAMKSVNVSFRLPYYTQWGQSLLVCGSEPVLGSRNVKKGLLLCPVHQGDELMWRGCVAVPSEFSCQYSYHVVDDERDVLRWELGTKRTLFLPQGINSGETVELRDLWQPGSDAVPCRSALKNVIFGRSWDLKIERPLGLQNKLDKEDAVLVQFRVCCPNLEVETVLLLPNEVYAIGSNANLGQWKVQDGLKLCYAGDSIWHADCVIRKSDFQYKYCKYGKAGNFSLETGSNRDLKRLRKPKNDWVESYSLSDSLIPRWKTLLLCSLAWVIYYDPVGKEIDNRKNKPKNDS